MGVLKRISLTIVLCWLGISTHAQLVHYSLDFTLSHANFVDSIGIEWDRRQVYLPVTIEGKTLRFLFDTGAGQSVVFSDTPLDGCKPAGEIISYDANNQRKRVEVVELPPLTIGKVTFTGMKATRQERVVRGRNIDGIIGFDIICKGLCAKIDALNRLLVLTDRKKFFAGEHGVDLRYRLNYHVPYIEVSPFGKFKEHTLFDTGSRWLYAMNKSSFDVCEEQEGALMSSQVEGRSIGRHAMGHFGLEPRGEVVFLNLSQLKMGRYSFNDVHTLTTHGESHIGAQVLEYGALIINPFVRRMKFLPYDNPFFTNVNNLIILLSVFITVDAYHVASP